MPSSHSATRTCSAFRGWRLPSRWPWRRRATPCGPSGGAVTCTGSGPTRKRPRWPGFTPGAGYSPPLAEFASVMVVPFSGGQVAPSRVPAGLHTRPASSGSGLDEVEQVGVEGVLVGGGVSEAVRGPGVDLQGRVLDDLRRQEGRGTDGHDLVVVAVDDQGRDVDLLEVFGEVGLGEGIDAVVRALHADAHAHQPERVAQALGHGVAGPVGAVEGRAEVLVELGPVGGE